MNHDEAMRRIARGEAVSSYDRNLWGQGSDMSGYWSANRGEIPKHVAKSLDTVAQEHGGYDGVVYSYRTPIAVCIDWAWLAPDVVYSATTSTKHQSRLYMLGALWIPGDAGPDEIRGILEGRLIYSRDTKQYRRGKW